MTAFAETPHIEKNPNSRVPLVAMIYFKTGRPVTTTLAIDDGRKRRSVVYDRTHNPEQGLPVIGLRAASDHRITLSARAADGTEYGPVALSYRTPALPGDSMELPRLTTLVSKPAEMEPGFTILSIRRRPVTRMIWATAKQFEFLRDWSMLVALDEAGEVVWYYTADSRIAGVHQLDNGNLFFHHVDFRSVEMDMCGNIINQFHASRRPWGPVENSIGIEADSLHHQPHQMPGGNYLALTANAREIDNYYTSETDPQEPRARQKVVGDNIVEFTPAGEVVWNWNTFDYLDPLRFGYHLLEPYWHTRGFPGHLDWTHGNGLCYDPADDSIIVSLRHQDALVKIERASKQIKWILGDHKGWQGDLREKLLHQDGDFRWHYHGHNPRLGKNGTIVMYDNGIVRAIPYDAPKAPHECFARAVEYAVDEQNMKVREVWTSSDDSAGDRVVSWAMGDAHYLPASDTMLVIDSFCLPMGENMNRTGSVKLGDLTWNEWRRDEWHPSDFPYWARIREMKHDAGRAVVFEVHVDHEYDIVGWEVFGGLRAKSLYPKNVRES